MALPAGARVIGAFRRVECSICLGAQQGWGRSTDAPCGEHEHQQRAHVDDLSTYIGNESRRG
jgi:hypothetical protein